MQMICKQALQEAGKIIVMRKVFRLGHGDSKKGQTEQRCLGVVGG